MLVALMLGLTAASGAFGADPELPAGNGGLLEDMPSFGWAFIKMMIVLAAILIGLLVVAKWVLPKLMRTTPLGFSGGIIEVLDVQRLEPRRNIYLIRVAGECFLIGTSEGGIQTLSGGKLEASEVEVLLRAAADRRKSRASRQASLAAGPEEPGRRLFAGLLRKSN
ncbi:MAG: flagellar biosynthetic protein FliO [Phycisphaerae bacterium]